MTKRISKLLSMLLATVMVLSMAMTGFAAEIEPLSSSTDSTFSITVTGAANGETYNAYKIFDVTYSDKDSEGNVGYSYTIDSGSAWYSTVAAATDVFTLTQVGDSSTYIVTLADGIDAETDADKIIAVFTDANIDLSVVTADATATAASGTAVLNVTNSGAGYYYVTTSLGSLVFIDTTNPTPEIEEKNGIPTVSKTVMENSTGDYGIEDDMSNNDDVTFKVDIANINGAVNLVLHDSMDAELEIPDTSDFHMDSVILYKSSSDTGTELTEGQDEDDEDGDYYVTIGACTVEGCELDKCAFEIHFKDSLFDDEDLDESGHIVIIYKLHLDTENDAYEDDYEEIVNDAQVSFGTTSFSAVVYADTYSFGFEVYKFTGEIVYNDETGESDPTNTTPLEGVEFELQNRDGATAYFEVENVEGKTIYLFEGWGDEFDNSLYTQTLVTGNDGMIYIEGLDTGTYTLTETKAPDGFNPLTGSVTVTIDATYNEETGEMTSHTVTYTYGDDEGTGVVDIQNNAGSILPSTGGMGTTLFYIVGIILVLGAAVLFVTKKRLDREE